MEIERGWYYVLRFHGYLSGYSIVIPAIATVFLWRRVPAKLFPLVCLILAYLACEILNTTLALQGLNNRWSFRIVTLFEFSFLTWLFLRSMPGLIPDWIAVCAFVAFYSVAFVDGMYIEGWFNYDSIPIGITCVWVVLMVIIYLYRLLQLPDVLELERLPMFWVCIAVLVYFAANIFIFLFHSDLMQHILVFRSDYLVFHSVMNISYNCLLCTALVKGARYGRY